VRGKKSSEYNPALPERDLFSPGKWPNFVRIVVISHIAAKVPAEEIKQGKRTGTEAMRKRAYVRAIGIDHRASSPITQMHL
jgi:hypothetical protein